MTTEQIIHPKVSARIVIPAKPEVLIQLSAEAKKDEPCLLSMERIIAKDVGIAGGVMSIANSVNFGGRKFGSLKEAVVFLGSKILVSFAISSAIRNALGKPTRAMGLFWEKTVAMAECSTMLSKLVKAPFGRIASDEIYTYCLFQECGQAVMMMNYPDYDKVISGFSSMSCEDLVEMENRHFGIDHAYIGHLLSAYWGLPEAMCTSIKYHASTHEWRKEIDNIPQSSLPYMVFGHMANMMAMKRSCTYSAEADRFREMVASVMDMTYEEYDELISGNAS